MKTKTFILSSLLSFCSLTSQAQTAMEIAPDMVPGWNLGNTLEAGDCSWITNELDYETAWQGTTTTQKIIDYVKEVGFRSVRIPCSWFVHMDANYNISPAWMDRVQEIGDYCFKDSLYVVLNDHYDLGWIERSFEEQTPSSVSKNCFVLNLMWKQIATRFRDYDHHLLFAGMNEPDAAGDKSKDREADIATLIKYEQTFVNAVRQTGGNNTTRVLVVQGPITNIDLTYQYYTMPEDPTPSALMLEVHYYSPFTFCLMEKDADWGPTTFYWGEKNHVKGSKRNNTSNWEETYTSAQMRLMKSKFSSKGIPVVLGEYGALWRTMPEGEDQDKHNASIYDWYWTLCRYAVHNGIIPFVWDTNYCGHPSGTVIDRKHLSIFNQFAYDGIMDGCASVQWPYTNDINNVIDDRAASSRCYTLTGIALDREPEKGLYIKDGRVFRR